MTQTTMDVRKKTQELVAAYAAGDAQVRELINVWLESLDEADLADIAPQTLASALKGFDAIANVGGAGCRIGVGSYTDNRGTNATALLILNPDMPFLVDSIVMALRKQRVTSRAVLNAVLAVERDASGKLVKVGAAKNGGQNLESHVLCFLSESLADSELAVLEAAIKSVAADAAAVHRDVGSMVQKLRSVAQGSAANGPDGAEAAAFLDWASNGGFEPFGYAYYRVEPGSKKLVRDLESRTGVLRDTTHPIYDKCLAGIPEDYETIGTRNNALSVVKADTVSTLHRDQQLDFIGLRDVTPSGEVLGEHCFVGLFSRLAAATPLAQLPFARGRIKQVLTLAGVRQEGFRAEKFLEILESLPRTEVLEAEPEWLAQVCGTVVALYKQPRAKVFARRDVYGRHLNVLIYMPRERYSANLATSLAHSLRNLAGASDVRAQTLLADGPLARLYLIATGARANLELEGDIQQPLLAAIDGWFTTFDEHVDGTEDAGLRAELRKLRGDLPGEYVAATAPQTAYNDLVTLIANRDNKRIKVAVDIGFRGAVMVRLLSNFGAPSLSQILPAMQNAGVAVDREQTHVLKGVGEQPAYVTCLTVDAESAKKLARPDVTGPACELFESLFNNEAEDGRMNGLVIEAGLRQKEVQVVRAYSSYLRQAGSRYSLRYIADCLRKQSVLMRDLVDQFLIRFNPVATEADRNTATEALQAMKRSVADLNHADTEDIVRSIIDLILATLRTSYYQESQAGDTIIFKFNTSNLSLLPEPRPYREIFVFSRRFEGVHLRGGPVARGGLRWSDRMEDYRTEVLGLVKAQMVKNAVIVPAGAKGGFVCKMMPPGATREVIAQEGESVYRLFIAGLLDVTDNRVRGSVVSPANTVCYDDHDPYLVVAADKGTATFSDIANGIAVKRGFWLGDAFASGGSNGYDHKKLGITAKGAWEAVKRHFYEMGHDLNTTPITAVGIGDMSGDVFGNGVLLSRQLKLVAAFDHRHIFIDPNPDLETSFVERQRMFALPRSSWEDYNKSLISQGGGVWSRSVRTIDLSPEARAALGIEAVSMTPEQLMHAILLAPVDLFYNGGIGTYIKSAAETHAQVKDRANDAIRVNGAELRCKVVAEGGNLGATQAGRIEFAQKGGRIFTDAIDNSAGVDCSDHEVNVKIWLDTEVNAGTLSEADRNRILNDITDDIEALVLRDNSLQTHLLVREEQAQSDASVTQAYADLIAKLEGEGLISREFEQLPSETELARRKAEGRGLTAPELAVVMAHVKNRYKRLLAEQNLLEFGWAKVLLTPYFPAALVKTRDPLQHPLANAILATVLANESVNRCGPLMLVELANTHRIADTSVVIAWAQAWAALNLAPVFDALDAHALDVPCAVSKQVHQRSRALQKAMIGGVLSVPADQLKGSTAIRELEALFAQADAAAKLLGAPIEARGNLPAAFGSAWQSVNAIEGIADFLFGALTVSRPANLDFPSLLHVGLQLRKRTGIDTLERTLTTANAQAHQEGLRARGLHALRNAQQRMLSHVLASGANSNQALEQLLGRIAAAERVEAELAGLEASVLAAWALSDSAVAATAN